MKTESELIANEASEYVDTLISEMFEGEHDNNQVLLGTVLSGDESIQIQLIVTRKPEDFMDE